MISRVIYILNIVDHDGKVYLPEVLWACMHKLFNIDDTKVNMNKQIREIVKMLQRKYPDLKKDRGSFTLDDLTGNVFHDINEITAFH
jgi:hypothetical protein